MMEALAVVAIILIVTQTVCLLRDIKNGKVK